MNEDLDKTLSFDEYKSSVGELFHKILLKRFPNEVQKQRIQPHVDRITGACPYCGDSTQNLSKKRGNIILKGKFAGHYKCFNCGTFKDVDKFLKDFKIDAKLDLVNFLSESKGNLKTSNYGSYDISVLMDTKTIELFALDRELLKDKMNLVEIEGTSVQKWLRARLQYENERFLYNAPNNYLVILNLTHDNKIIGFQKRNFRKGQEKYNTYTLRKIYSLLDIDKEIPEEVDILSQIYKISEINFGNPVTLFEGPLDAFLYKNSVANAGANKGFPIEIPLRYWFDDDNTGRKLALDKIGKGEAVFLWTKFKTDYNLPYRKKWDLNDLLLWFKEQNKRIPYFDNYFSQDPLDSIDI